MPLDVPAKDSHIPPLETDSTENQLANKICFLFSCDSGADDLSEIMDKVSIKGNINHWELGSLQIKQGPASGSVTVAVVMLIKPLHVYSLSNSLQIHLCPLSFVYPQRNSLGQQRIHIHAYIIPFCRYTNAKANEQKNLPGLYVAGCTIQPRLPLPAPGLFILDVLSVSISPSPLLSKNPETNRICDTAHREFKKQA